MIVLQVKIRHTPVDVTEHTNTLSLKKGKDKCTCGQVRMELGADGGLILTGNPHAFPVQASATIYMELEQ